MPTGIFICTHSTKVEMGRWKKEGMLEIAKKFEIMVTDRMGLSEEFGGFVYGVAVCAVMILAAISINWRLQAAFRWVLGMSTKLKKSRWHGYLVRRKVGHHVMLMVPGLILYGLPHLFYETGDPALRYLHRADIIYMIIVMIMILNAVLYCFLDYYSTTDKNKKHPLKGLVQALQVIIYFVGSIIIVAILIDKSPAVLLTGLGASAAVLMLIFKDSILGFVAGVQLSQSQRHCRGNNPQHSQGPQLGQHDNDDSAIHSCQCPVQELEGNAGERWQEG